MRRVYFQPDLKWNMWHKVTLSNGTIWRLDLVFFSQTEPCQARLTLTLKIWSVSLWFKKTKTLKGQFKGYILRLPSSCILSATLIVYVLSGVSEASAPFFRKVSPILKTSSCDIDWTLSYFLPFFFFLLSPQILFLSGPVPCGMVQRNGVQEYFDQPQDAFGSHARRRAQSAQQSDQRQALLALPLIFRQQPAQCNLRCAVETHFLLPDSTESRASLCLCLIRDSFNYFAWPVIPTVPFTFWSPRLIVRLLKHTNICTWL